MNWGILFAIQYVGLVALSWQLFRTSNALRECARARDELSVQAFGAVVFANALAEKGITIPCDDCGNPMSPDDSISIMPHPNGGWYVGHRSHNRHVDWGTG